MRIGGDYSVNGEGFIGCGVGISVGYRRDSLEYGVVVIVGYLIGGLIDVGLLCQVGVSTVDAIELQVG